MNLEIERKWLVKGFPQGVEPDAEYALATSYLVSKDSEVRIRQVLPYPPPKVHTNKMSEYKLTIKGPGTHSRTEVEIELNKFQYDKLFQSIPNATTIIKQYHKYVVDDYIIEISKVDNMWYYAEVEFKNTKEMMNYKFPWPEIVIDEVTMDDRYKMKNYWNAITSDVSSAYKFYGGIDIEE